MVTNIRLLAPLTWKLNLFCKLIFLVFVVVKAFFLLFSFVLYDSCWYNFSAWSSFFTTLFLILLYNVCNCKSLFYFFVCVWNASNTNNKNNISIILWWQITVFFFFVVIWSTDGHTDTIQGPNMFMQQKQTINMSSYTMMNIPAPVIYNSNNKL
jgi:hypothetical protein